MLDLTNLCTLSDEAEYDAALKAVRPYFEIEPAENTPEAAHFNALVRMIEDYERRRYPIPRATPVEAPNRL